LIDEDPTGIRRTGSGLWVPGSEANGEEETPPGSPQAEPSAGKPDLSGTEDRSEAATPAADEEPPSPEAELESARAEAAQHHDSWLRAAAELENYRRRAAREAREGAARAQAEVLRSLLGVLDDVERALAATETAEESSDDPIVSGVRLIRSRLLDILRQYGVVEIAAEGRPFDPHLHEAVMQLPSEEVADGHVAQVLERGYQIGERVLRPARVAVARPVDHGDGTENG
jgi:molecular chaperone GrpE